MSTETRTGRTSSCCYIRTHYTRTWHCQIPSRFYNGLSILVLLDSIIVNHTTWGNMSCLLNYSTRGCSELIYFYYRRKFSRVIRLGFHSSPTDIETHYRHQKRQTLFIWKLLASRVFENPHLSHYHHTLRSPGVISCIAQPISRCHKGTPRKTSVRVHSLYTQTDVFIARGKGNRGGRVISRGLGNLTYRLAVGATCTLARGCCLNFTVETFNLRWANDTLTSTNEWKPVAQRAGKTGRFSFPSRKRMASRNYLASSSLLARNFLAIFCSWWDSDLESWIGDFILIIFFFFFFFSEKWYKNIQRFGWYYLSLFRVQSYLLFIDNNRNFIVQVFGFCWARRLFAINTKIVSNLLEDELSSCTELILLTL